MKQALRNSAFLTPQAWRNHSYWPPNVDRCKTSLEIANLNNVAVGVGHPGGRRCQLPLLWNVKRGEVGREVQREGHGFMAKRSYWRMVQTGSAGQRSAAGEGAHCALFTVISMGHCLRADKERGRSPSHMHACLCTVQADAALFRVDVHGGLEKGIVREHKTLR